MGGPRAKNFIVSKIVGFSAPNASTRFANESSDRNVSKLVSGIKVPSHVVSDIARRGVAAKFHTGDVLRGCGMDGLSRTTSPSYYSCCGGTEGTETEPAT